MKKENLKTVLFSTFVISFIISIGYGVFISEKYIALKGQLYNIRTLEFDNANSRETYFTMHNIKAAHQLSTGKGIKVGILDSYFGFNEHYDLFAGKKDLINNEKGLYEVSEHGYWMAKALKEIAPGAEVYAINVMENKQGEGEKAAAIIKAIDWAIENKIDILTYSSGRFTGDNEKVINEGINRAVRNGIATCFIHCPNENNLLPTYMAVNDSSYDGREADLNIIGCDFNTLFLEDYLQIQSRKDLTTKQKNDILFGSVSSTAPVAAGLIALLKEVRPGLKPGEYKNILVKTSRKEYYQGTVAPRVPNVYEAIKELENHEAF